MYWIYGHTWCTSWIHCDLEGYHYDGVSSSSLHFVRGTMWLWNSAIIAIDDREHKQMIITLYIKIFRHRTKNYTFVPAQQSSIISYETVRSRLLYKMYYSGKLRKLTPHFSMLRVCNAPWNAGYFRTDVPSLWHQQANSENCGPPPGSNFDLEVGQRSRSRSRHGVNWKG